MDKLEKRAMTQAIGRVDHVAILVRRENFQTYVDRLSEVLGISFDDPVIGKLAGVTASVAWEAGLEVIAPLKEEGEYWDKLCRFGEGTVTIIFGLNDMDAGVARAQANGVDIRWQFTAPMADEPLFGRFKLVREASLADLSQDTALSLALCQIEPL